MSTSDDFPRTILDPTTHHHSSAQRAIEIRWMVDPTAEPQSMLAHRLGHAPSVTVASIESHQQNGAAWSRPAFKFSGELREFARGEWDRLKREIDEAFSAFEATWPVADDEIKP